MWIRIYLNDVSAVSHMNIEYESSEMTQIKKQIMNRYESTVHCTCAKNDVKLRELTMGIIIIIISMNMSVRNLI